MDEKSSPTQADRPFRAVLTPNRSLPAAGFALLMAGLSIVSFAAGMAFYLMGAWPVLAFFGLDVLLVYVAFQLSYRSGRASETVEVDPAQLTVTRIDPAGRREAHTFATAWVRVNLHESFDGRCRLSLQHHDRELTVAACLSHEERRDFAHALQGAILTARGGPRI